MAYEQRYWRLRARSSAAIELDSRKNMAAAAAAVPTTTNIGTPDIANGYPASPAIVREPNTHRHGYIIKIRLKFQVSSEFFPKTTNEHTQQLAKAGQES